MLHYMYILGVHTQYVFIAQAGRQGQLSQQQRYFKRNSPQQKHLLLVTRQKS